MKKTLCILMASVMLLGLCACSKKTSTEEKPKNDTNTEIKLPTVTGDPNKEPEKEKTPEPENLVSINEITEMGKELKLYGNISDKDMSALEGILKNYNKNISLIAFSKDGSRALAYNTSQTYFSACTIKIGYMLSVCKQIDAGVADESELLTYQPKHYHKGSGQIKNSAYGTKYTIGTLIHESLNISDNVAYEMLIDRFGFEHYNKMVTDLGCTSVQLNGLWASRAKLKDFILIWDEAYDYFTSDAKMAARMKVACTNTPFNYGTETLQGIDYSHKSGDNFGYSAAYHDAGIVWDENPYIFAVFTNSEGKSTDINTVNRAMEIVNDVMGKK